MLILDLVRQLSVLTNQLLVSGFTLLHLGRQLVNPRHLAFSQLLLLLEELGFPRLDGVLCLRFLVSDHQLLFSFLKLVFHLSDGSQLVCVLKFVPQGLDVLLKRFDQFGSFEGFRVVVDLIKFSQAALCQLLSSLLRRHLNLTL